MHRGGNVDDHAIGIVEREHAVLDRRAQIEHQAGAIRAGPQTHVFDGRPAWRRARAKAAASRPRHPASMDTIAVRPEPRIWPVIYRAVDQDFNEIMKIADAIPVSLQRYVARR